MSGSSKKTKKENVASVLFPRLNQNQFIFILLWSRFKRHIFWKIESEMQFDNGECHTWFHECRKEAIFHTFTSKIRLWEFQIFERFLSFEDCCVKSSFWDCRLDKGNWVKIVFSWKIASVKDTAATVPVWQWNTRESKIVSFDKKNNFFLRLGKL